MSARRVRGLAAIAAVALAACAESPTGPASLPPDALLPELLRRIATLGFVAANGDDGRGFFDNFFPCMPRGALHYYDTPRGRHVGFTGCGLGAGIAVDGQGEIIWQDGGERQEFCDYAEPPNCMPGYRWEGRLTVMVAGVPAGALDSFRVSSVVPLPLDSKYRVRLRSLVASLGTLSVPMTDSTLREFYFDTSGVTLTSLPNPSQSLAALTAADLARLSFSLANELSWVLLDETLSSGVGDHVHQLACGTLTVTFAAENLPTIAHDLTGCNLAGVVVQGVFTTRWGELDDATGRLRLELAGNAVLGGRIPTIAITALTWQAVGISPLPGTATLSLVLAGSGGSRSFTVALPVDD